LGDEIALLIANGHTLEGIGNYDIEQFNLFVSCCTRLAARRRLEYIADTHAAIVKALSSKGNPIKEYLEELTDHSGLKDD